MMTRKLTNAPYEPNPAAIFITSEEANCVLGRAHGNTTLLAQLDGCWMLPETNGRSNQMRPRKLFRLADVLALKAKGARAAATSGRE